jgi:hypothetical protein
MLVIGAAGLAAALAAPAGVRDLVPRRAPGAPVAQSATAAAPNARVRDLALHHVRTPDRLIDGGVALVRQHMRGCARFGQARQRHRGEATRSTPPP